MLRYPEFIKSMVHGKFKARVNYPCAPINEYNTSFNCSRGNKSSKIVLRGKIYCVSSKITPPCFATTTKSSESEARKFARVQIMGVRVTVYDGITNLCRTRIHGGVPWVKREFGRRCKKSTPSFRSNPRRDSAERPLAIGVETRAACTVCIRLQISVIC